VNATSPNLNRFEGGIDGFGTVQSTMEERIAAQRAAKAEQLARRDEAFRRATQVLFLRLLLPCFVPACLAWHAVPAVAHFTRIGLGFRDLPSAAVAVARQTPRCV
jgi:hypothetical protein